jgi:hypothetical protein
MCVCVINHLCVPARVCVCVCVCVCMLCSNVFWLVRTNSGFVECTYAFIIVCVCVCVMYDT